MNRTNYDQQNIEFLRHILQIYTPSGNEYKLKDFYTEYLQNHGFKIIESSVGNVIGYKGNGSPVLLLSSHLDTIPPELPFLETETEFFARGAVDCKPAWASMICSAANFDWDKLFKSNNSSGTVIIAGLVREEDSTIGMEDFFSTSLTPDYAIFGEPTNINRICYAYKGRIWLNIVCEAEQGHASSCWNYLNPIEVVIQFWNELKELGTYYQKPVSLENECNHFDEITLSLTQIHAGDIGNAIPRSCSADIDIRMPPETNFMELCDKIALIKQKIETEFGTSLKLDFKSKISGAETDTNSILVNALRWAIFKSTKKKAILLKKTGTTFMNMIKEHYKIPTIVYGPGNPRLEHSDDEKITKQEFLDAIFVYENFYHKFYELWKKFKENSS